MLTAALSTTVKLWKEPKCLLDKDTCTYTHARMRTGILLNHQKEGHPAICNDVYGARVYYTK